MSFYSQLVSYYDLIFPVKSQTLTFLNEFINDSTTAILDIGCGTGVALSSLIGRGVTAVGIDLNLEMVRYASIKHPAIDFHCLDMRQLASLDRQFDLIYSIGNVVSYLTPSEMPDLVRQVYCQLGKNGHWIFQTVNWDYIRHHSEFHFPVITNVDHDFRFVRKYRQKTTDSVDFTVKFFLHDNLVFEETNTLFPIIAADMHHLHVSAGFRLMHHFGNFSKELFQPTVNSGSVFVFQKTDSFQ